MILNRWNIVVNEVSEIEKDKYFLKTNVGDVINTVIENVPYEKMTSNQENSPMLSIGYIFTPKGDNDVEVTLWTEFELENQRGILQMAGDLFLKSLKVYVDYIEKGGDPAEYKKDFNTIKNA